MKLIIFVRGLKKNIKESITFIRNEKRNRNKKRRIVIHHFPKSNFIFANVYDLQNTLVHEDDHFLFANDSIVKGKGQVLDLESFSEYQFWNNHKEKRAYIAQNHHKTWHRTTDYYSYITKRVFEYGYGGNPIRLKQK